ncbi:MAG: M48 family metalloprotease [Gammaproteobacteria bacterium]|nr:M48 family metalloprotease [Gammaproteobacteria bacterium]NNF61210.1 M48 family metalloprotease [Gammaproteobacteria bacterium]NNM20706.1 M48 family metalloprotease [Gammaproteobacteria bacterium]
MNLHAKSRILSLLLVVATLVACSTNPVTGKREILLMTAEQERAIGAQAAEQVEQTIGLVDAPQLVNYVQAIGNRLAAVSPRQDVEYTFQVANMAEPNAFALPGGYIYVSRGLLAIANSEDELANVIGHEIGHVAARHSAQRQTRATGVGLLTVLGTVLAGSKGGAQAAQTASQLGQALGAGLIASYSRDQERQSDEIGQKMAAQTGWNPIGMAEFMQQLGGYTVLVTGSARQPTWLDSHPPTTERVETSAARARELTITSRAPIADSRLAFYNYMDGLLVGDDPAAGVFRESLFLHPQLDFALVFPSGWQTQNQPSAVLAGPKEGDAMLQLQLQGAGSDPQAAAREYAGENNLTYTRTSAGRIGNYSAYQAIAEAQTEQGNLGLHLTWIAHPAGMFRLTGMTPVERFNNYAATFAATADSFRGMTAQEKTGMTERRLDVVTARRGETLEALSSRTGNAWTLDETRLANDLPAGAVLSAGQPMKIAVDIPYRP